MKRALARAAPRRLPPLNWLRRPWLPHPDSQRSLELQCAQAQRIHNYRYGAERHRQGGDDRTEEHMECWVEDTRGDRDTDHVVGKRKYQILPNVTHCRPA